jgi:hypothetical protein
MGPNLGNSRIETFNITNYGSLTANFTPSLTIPPDLLYGVILGPIVGAIVGWFIPFILNRRSKR